MHLRACLARSSDDPAISCSAPVAPSLPFCRVHYEEYRMLKEKEASAIREAEGLAPIIEDMTRDNLDEYKTIREIRRDGGVARMYLGAIERCAEAGELLRARFLSDTGEHRPNFPMLSSERRQRVAAFLEQLEVRLRVIATTQEPELPSVPEEVASDIGGANQTGRLEPHPSSDPGEHTQAGNSLPATNPSPRQMLRIPSIDLRPSRPIQFDPVSFAGKFEATARHILNVPHAAFSCPDTPSMDTSGNKKCPTIQLTTSKPCTMQPTQSNRFCPLHIMTHAAASVPIRVDTQFLERSRVEIARINIGHGDTASNIAIARKYISAVEDLEQLRIRHQETYSCLMHIHAAPDEYKSILDDLAKRRTSAVLLLGILKGRTAAVIHASRQGQEERWAAEYLAEVKRAEREAALELGGRLTVGAAVGAGLTAFFGGPLGVGAMVGAAVLAASRPEKDGAV
ncbi:hypothetical protein C8Q80DRAFT_346658 [Daedaleopsis nitida]|nr:hypothetical protein C8Q80DRAFT_346658 [Daedaleopsis nitida]